MGRSNITLRMKREGGCWKPFGGYYEAVPELWTEQFSRKQK